MLLPVTDRHGELARFGGELPGRVVGPEAEIVVADREGDDSGLAGGQGDPLGCGDRAWESFEIVASAAVVFGRADHAAAFGDLADRLKSAFHDQYVDGDRTVRSG